MFYWPHLELTDYEKQFVAAYKVLPHKDAEGNSVPGKPGVLRRTYKCLLNNVINTNVPGFEQIHLTDGVQISRRSRVFGLTFSGDVSLWRLNIQNASGEQFTPKAPGVSGASDPRVSSMVPGTSWNSGAGAMILPLYSDTFTVPDDPDTRLMVQANGISLPLIIEPNWQFVPNEQLLFTGTPLTESAIILEIGVHVWEFPGMVEGAPPLTARKPRRKDHKLKRNREAV